MLCQLYNYIHYLPHCDQNTFHLTEKEFVVAQDFRRFIPLWWSMDGEPAQLTSWWAREENGRDTSTLMPFSSSSFIPSRLPTPGTSREDLPSSVSSLLRQQRRHYEVSGWQWRLIIMDTKEDPKPTTVSASHTCAVAKVTLFTCHHASSGQTSMILWVTIILKILSWLDACSDQPNPLLVFAFWVKLKFVMCLIGHTT